MEREAEALGELPLEDGVVDEKGSGKDGKGKKSNKALSNGPQTPSTAAVPSSGESHTKVSLPSNTSTEVDSRSMHLGLKDRHDRLDLRPRERGNS